MKATMKATLVVVVMSVLAMGAFLAPAVDADATATMTAEEFLALDVDSDGTIVLTEDIALGEQLVLDNDLKIDTAGFNLIVASDCAGYGIIVNETASLEVVGNGALVSTYTGDWSEPVTYGVVKSLGELALTDISVVSGTRECSAIKIGSATVHPTATLTNVGITVAYCAGVEVYGDTVLEDCMIAQSGTYVAESYEWMQTAVGVGYGATATLNGGAYYTENGYALAIWSSGGTIIVDDASVAGQIKEYSLDLKSYPDAASDIQAVSGMFTTMDAINHLVEKSIVSIVLQDDTVGAPVYAGDFGATIDIDLCGFTYTFTGDCVGDGAKLNQVMHLGDNTISISNGTLATDGVNNLHMKDDAVKKSQPRFFIQNYSDLTLDSVVIDAADVYEYVLSSNEGIVDIVGSTSFENSVDINALDATWWPSRCPDGTSVTIDTTGTLEGNITIGFYGADNTSDDPMPIPSKTVLDVRNLALDGTFVLELGDDYAESGYSTGLTEEQIVAMVESNVVIEGITLLDSAALGFATAQAVDGAVIVVSDDYVATTDDALLIYHDVTLVISEGITYTGIIEMGFVPTLGASPYGSIAGPIYRSGSNDILNLDGVTAGASGFDMHVDGISGSIASGSVTLNGSFHLDDDLSLGSDANVVIPLGSSVTIPAETSMAGGSVENYGTVSVDGKLGSTVDNNGTVRASVTGMVTGSVEGTPVIDEKPVVEVLPVYTVELGQSIDVAIEFTEGATVQIGNTVAWAKLNDAGTHVVGTPDNIGEFTVILTAVMGDKIGESASFKVIVTEPASVPDNGDKDEPKDDSVKKVLTASLAITLIILIVFAIIVIMVLRMLLGF